MGKASTFLRLNGVGSRYLQESTCISWAGVPWGKMGKVRLGTGVPCQGTLLEHIRKRARACTLAGPAYLLGM